MFGTDFININCALAFFLSFILSLALYPFLIRWLKKQNVRSQGHVDHLIDASTKLEKEKTPSFGGALFVFIPFLAPVLFFPDLPVIFYPLLLSTLLFAGVGLLDDLFKIWHPARGISAKAKSFGQIAASLSFLFFIPCNTLHVPFLGDFLIAGYWMIPFILFLLFVMVGTSNAVNLTDGMDGLAGSLSLVSYLFLCIFALLEGQSFLACMIASCLGALLAFTYFNRKPAKIFMGDIGSLPLGGLIAAFAILLRQEFLLILLGGMFVVETVSVMIQVAYYKRTRRRIFACAPLHHHYQSKGWTEQGIVANFLVWQFAFSFIGLIIYILC